MTSKTTKQNVLLLDDSLLVRLVIKRLFAAYFKGFDLYTASHNLQGLGLAYALDCKVLIIDTTLPKYDGKEVIEYIRTNQRFKQNGTHIIVLYRDGIKTADFDDSVTFIDKDSAHFLGSLLGKLSELLDVPITKKHNSAYLRVLRFLGKHIINKEDQSIERLFSTVKSKNILAKIWNLFRWTINQFVSSLYLLLFYIVGGREIKEANADQSKRDISIFRRKYYPTMVIAMTSFLVIILQGGVITSTLIAVGNRLNVRTLAASTRTWDGGGGDNNWSTCANWSSDTCPIVGDTALFNGTSTKDGTIDVNYGGSIIVTISSGYTGTITQAAILSVSTWTQSDGHYVGSTQNLTVSNFTLNTGGDFNSGSSATSFSSSFTINGGSFTATSGTMAVGNTFTITGGTFSANGGTVTFAGNGTLSCNNIVFNLVVLGLSSGTKTVSSDCSLPLGNNPSVNGTGTLALSGTLSGTGTLTRSQTGITFNTGAVLSGFTGLNKGSTSTFTIAGANLDLSAYTSINIDTFIVNSGSIVFGPGLNVGNLTVSGGTVNSTTGNLTVSAFTLSSGTFNAPTGIFNVSNGFNATGTGTFNNNSATVKFTNGGTVTCGSAVFNLVVFANGVGTVTVSNDCDLPLGASPTLSGGSVIVNGTLNGSGTFTKTGGTLTLNSTAVLNTFSDYSVTSLTIAGATLDLSAYGSFTASGTVIVNSGTLSLPNAGADLNGDLTISGGTFNAPSGTMTFAGTLNISGSPTFNANGGTFTIDGGAKTLTCNNVTFNAVTFNNTSTKTVASSCSLPLGANPTIPNGITLSGTLSGSGTLTYTTGTFTMNSGGTLSGFNGLSASAFTVAGATVDLTGYTFTATNTVTLSSGTLSLPTNVALTGGSALVISGGTFNAPSGTLTLPRALTISGSPTFNANGGIVDFHPTGTSTYACGNVTFNSVTFANITTSAANINSDCNLPLGADPVFGSTSSGATITLNGTITGSGTITKAQGTFTVNSTGVLSGFSALNLNSLTVAGASLNLSSYSSFITAGTVTLSSGTLSLPVGSDINGSLSISGGTFTAPSGNMTLAGALTISGSPTFNANSGTVIFDGSGATLSCNNVTFNQVIFNNSGTKTVNSNCALPISNDPTIPNSVTLNGSIVGTGTLTMTTGTLTLNAGSAVTGFDEINASAVTVGGGTIDWSAMSSLVVNSTFRLNSGSITLPSDTHIKATLIIAGGTFTAPSGNLYLESSLTISGSPTFNANGGTVVIQSVGGGATLACNGVTFNLVQLDYTGSTPVVNSDCTLPLGADPTIPYSLNVSGTLTGSGMLTFHNLLTLNAGSAVSGFDAWDGGLIFINGANVDLSAYDTVDISNFSMSSGSFIAPVLMTDSGNFTHNGGTFDHNNGTIVFGSDSDTNIDGSQTTTFYNLTKSVISARNLKFKSGVTQTVLNDLILTGTSGNILSLISTSSNNQWSIDAEGSRTLEYLSVRDSNNINSTPMVALFSSGVSGNTNWVFNVAPDDPSDLGPTDKVDGSYTSQTQPTLSFDLTDGNGSDQVTYQIQIDDTSDFSSVIIDYTSDLLSQGDSSYAIGQASGTYNTGSEAMSLADGSYYWRVKATDESSAESNWTTANSGSVAFRIDTTAPTGSIVINDNDSTTTSQDVTLTLQATDSGAGVSQMIISESNTFVGASYIAYTTSQSFHLSDGYGLKTVFVKYKDAIGNVSVAYSDSITYPLIPSSSSSSSSASSSSSSSLVSQSTSSSDSASTSSSTSSEIFSGGGPNDGSTVQTIVVKLLLPDGTPISNVKVKLDTADGQQTTTDVNGVAVFIDVPNGDHKVLGVFNSVPFEQAISIDGSKNDFKIVLEVQTYPDTNILVLVIVAGGLLGGIIVWLYFRKRLAIDQINVS